MPTIKVVNIKCGGCAAQITASLAQAGLTEIKVSPEQQTVSFVGDETIAKRLLSEMGYPEAGSPEAGNLLKKAKSYVSCLIGRTKK